MSENGTDDGDGQRGDLSREDAHPRARAALTDAFFWDASDPSGPFGDETGLDVLEALRDLRVEDPRGSPLVMLSGLLARWEIADEGWDVVEAGEVQALGEADELGLVTRDQAIVALAFAQIIVDGKVDAEVRRRAILALARQGLPALLAAFGLRARRREAYVTRMREVLAQRWD
jgi:uncharacterized protein YfeS